MPKVGCAIVGCSNSTYRINKWKNEIYNLHNVLHQDCESIQVAYVSIRAEKCRAKNGVDKGLQKRYCGSQELEARKKSAPNILQMQSRPQSIPYQQKNLAILPKLPSQGVPLLNMLIIIMIQVYDQAIHHIVTMTMLGKMEIHVKVVCQRNNLFSPWLGELVLCRNSMINLN